LKRSFFKEALLEIFFLLESTVVTTKIFFQESPRPTLDPQFLIAFLTIVPWSISRLVSPHLLAYAKFTSATAATRVLMEHVLLQSNFSEGWHFQIYQQHWLS